MSEQPAMRQLLERWAAVEPERCRLQERIQGFTVDAGEMWYLILDCKLSAEEALMKIQWAVQQAITARGWHLETHYTPVSGHDATAIEPHTRRVKGHGNNPAEALLTAYLAALEANKKAG